MTIVCRCGSLLLIAREQFAYRETEELLKTLDSVTRVLGVSRGQAFEDFLHMTVCALSGGAMEEQYLSVVAKHTAGKKGKRGCGRIAQMLAELVNIMEETRKDNREGKLPALPDDLSNEQRIHAYLASLLPAVGSLDPAAALVPWICDRLPSINSRKAYASDLSRFVSHMRALGVDPLAVTGDHVRIYKEVIRSQAGASSASIGRALSVIRGAYTQFGKHGLIDWKTVGDIQAVASPRVDKNTTPALSENEAKRLLHAPDEHTLQGIRDHALLFTFFVTACRVSALAGAKVGDLERTDTSWYLVVHEKGGKRQRKALLQAAGPLLRYLNASAVTGDLDGPLFRPLTRDRRSFEQRALTRRAILLLVKKYCRQAGINPDRVGRRGVGVHSLRKTSITNALEHGAKMEQVQALAGHSDIRTTQLYYRVRDTDSEDAARHIQIR